jgi:hypothetical protein
MEDNLLPDDQLDHLFRDASEGIRPSFDEAAWQAMSARLDQHKPIPVAQKSKWQNALWLLLLLIPTAWWANVQTKATKNTLSTTNQATTGGSKVEFSSKNAPTTVQLPINKQPFLTENNKPNTPILVKKNHTVQNSTEPKFDLQTKALDTDLVENSDNQSTQTPVYQNITNNQITFVNTKTDFQFLKIKDLNLLAQFKNPSIVLPKTQEQSITTASTDPTTKRPVVGLRLMAATDVNSVGATGGFKDLGQSIGVLIEYEVAKRWKIQTGFIKTSKNYVAPLQDYTLPETSSWAMGIKPAQVEAQCEILDIPLNIRFDAIRQGKHDFFVNTGLSSYLMVSEKYHYDYDANYGHMLKGSLLQDRQLYRSSDYLFSTFNLSMGYERQLKHGFSFQIEPYLKTPLKGVGWGSINLYSTGVILSLKHGL